MKAGRKRLNSRPPSDPLLVPRVKRYLADNVDKTYVDVTLMARDLRERYRDYASKPEHGFYQSVEAAYTVVLHSYGLDEAFSPESDDSDDLELLDDDADNNDNDHMGQMYRNKKRPAPQAPHTEERDELIDISSDDGSDAPPPEPKTSKINDQLAIESRSASVSNPPAERTPTPEEPSSEVDKPKRRKIVRKSQSGNVQKPTKVDFNLERSKHFSKITFDDIGGINHIKEQICDLVLHMRHPEVYATLGVKAPRGALLHGPPGSGKTLLAHAIAGRLELPILSMVATELVGGVSGESEKLIRDTFERAASLAPCILFLDEIDSVCGNRVNAQKDMERRMVAQLLTSIDNLEEKNAQVLLLAATNNPDLLDPGLRRAGRLEQEIPLGIPTADARKDILRILCRKLNLSEDINLDVLSQFTPGFVGADLQALVNKSCTLAIKRVFKHIIENPDSETVASLPDNDIQNVIVVENVNGTVTANENLTPEIPEPVVNSLPVLDAIDPKEQNGNLDKVEVQIDENKTNLDEEIIQKENAANTITQNVTPEIDDLQKYIDDAHPFTPEQLSNMKIVQDDMINALKTTKPCAIREGFATVPDVTWDDVGSLADVRRDLQLTVLAPVKYPRELESLGLTIPCGVLLCGPPGCGKTLIAKAIANEAGINFISVKGPELLNMYVGESERAVRTCFQRAKNSAPCVIFFDEFDSLCPKRSGSDINGASRVVNQLLTEMDGVEDRKGVFVLAATNRPDIIDPAVLRPGRLDRIIFVGMPLFHDRIDILKAITKKGTKPRLNADVDLEAIAKATDGYTGADLAGLVRQAATQSLTDFVLGSLQDEPLSVSAKHFQLALAKLKPSVSSKEQQHYEKLRLKYVSAGDEKNDVEMDTTESMDTV